MMTNYSQALEQLQKAESLSRDWQYLIYLPAILVGQASLFAKQRDFARAIACINEAIEFAAPRELELDLAEGFLTLSQVLLKQSKERSDKTVRDGVLNSVNQAIRLAERTSHDWVKRESWSVLQQLFAQSGEIGLARDFAAMSQQSGRIK